MTALRDFVAGALPALVPFPPLPPWRLALSALLAKLKKEPVRAAALVVVVLLVVGAQLAGVPVPVLLGEVVAAVAVLERTRAAVAPLIDVVLHADDVPPGTVPVLVPAAGGALPADPEAVPDAPESDPSAS